MTEKPRKIVVTAKEGGASRPEDRQMGLHARDTQTGASLWLPLPVKINGLSLTGRGAAEQVAKALLSLQGSGSRIGFDRGTPDRDVFTVYDA